MRRLAEYEKLGDQVTASEEGLRHVLFGPSPEAESCSLRGRYAGRIRRLFHKLTFLGRRGLWLEDIFIEPVQRGKGYGKALLLAPRIAHERGCGRFSGRR